MKYDVAIIGGGPAGYTPRFFLRKTHWAGFV